MTKLENSPLIRALRRKTVPYTPIWIMRQAGRYLPEYRKIREKSGGFMVMCQTPEIACEITLQPVNRFNLDAAIIFSDILTIPDAMGLNLKFIEGVGPRFETPIKTAKAINELSFPNISYLNYVFDAIKLTKQALDDRIPLIGFSGSPWTLATYMIENGGSKEFKTVKRMLYATPELLHKLLDLLADAVSEYLIAQIKAGVDVIMLFDTWGGVLTTEAYQQFSLSYMKKIIEEIKSSSPAHQNVPIILFTKSGGLWLENMLDTKCDCIGLDWTIDIGLARQRVGGSVALQGNLDPTILFAKPAVIRDHVQTILTHYGHHPGHVFNLGHGILPDTPPENVALLVDTVHEISETIHSTRTR